VRAVERYAISREQHADGTLHLHAYISLTRKLNTTNQHVFDVRGFHPNIQSARNLKAVIAYVIKDGNFISNLPTTDLSANGSTTKKRTWGEILEESTNGANFLTMVRQEYPREYCIHNQRLREMAANEWPEVPLPYQPSFTQFTIPMELQEWATENIGQGFNGKVSMMGGLTPHTPRERSLPADAGPAPLF